MPSPLRSLLALAVLLSPVAAADLPPGLQAAGEALAAGKLAEATDQLPPALRPWLGRIARRQKKAMRWRALGLERRFGLKPSMPIPAHRFPAVLDELEAGRVPVEAALLALEALGDQPAAWEAGLKKR